MKEGERREDLGDAGPTSVAGRERHDSLRARRIERNQGQSLNTILFRTVSESIIVVARPIPTASVTRSLTLAPLP